MTVSLGTLSLLDLSTMPDFADGLQVCIIQPLWKSEGPSDFQRGCIMQTNGLHA